MFPERKSVNSRLVKIFPLILSTYEEWNFFQILTYYRPAMPFGNRKFFIEDLFLSVFSRNFKKSSLWKLEIELFWHFSNLKIAYFNEKNHVNIS